MYVVLSLIPIIFNYSYILVTDFNIPMLHLIRALLNWIIFPCVLVWINFINVYFRRLHPISSIFMSLFVTAMCYGSVYLTYYGNPSAPFDSFGLKALFLTNFYFFLPFAVIFVLDVLKILFFRRRK